MIKPPNPIPPLKHNHPLNHNHNHHPLHHESQLPSFTSTYLPTSPTSRSPPLPDINIHIHIHIRIFSPTKSWHLIPLLRDNNNNNNNNIEKEPPRKHQIDK